MLQNGIIFRNLKEPIGGVIMPKGVPYTVAGMFQMTEASHMFKVKKPFLQVRVKSNQTALR